MKLKILIGAILAVSLLPSIAVAEMSLADKYEDLEIVNQDDWRSFSFGDIIWSEPVIVQDDFEGESLAVFDRNKTGSMMWHGKESGIVSMWNQKNIRVYYYLREESKNLLENDKFTIREAETLTIKVGDELFNLEGKNGNFSMTAELANALANAPEGETKIRLTLEDSGENITNKIGKDTVKSWKTVYGHSSASK